MSTHVGEPLVERPRVHGPDRIVQIFERLGRPCRSPGGALSLSMEEAVDLVRRHVDLEKLRTSDFDAELWALWQEEVGRAGPATDNAQILDLVLEWLRVGD